MVHECKRCLHHSRHLIHATRLDIIKSFGDVSIYRARGVCVGGGGLISAEITWFSLKGKQIGDQSLRKDDKGGTMKN